MTTAAIVLSVIWFAVAFALRIAVQVRTTGDSGLRSNAGEVFSLGWCARLAFAASIVAIAGLPIAVAADWVGTVPSLQRGPVEWSGMVVAIGGVAATFWAQLAMGASWRIGVDPAERTDLVTTGVFAVVRNPIFSTMVLTAVGVTLMVPTITGFVSLVVLAIALEVQVRGVEEPYLRRLHGSEFAAYEATVGRFIPAVGLRRNS